MLSEHIEQYHIKTVQGEIGEYCILPGDPGRCDKIAAYLDCPYHVGQNREFNIVNGYLCGKLVTVCSTGIGGPSTAIAVEELFDCGARTFIRIGTCGGIGTDVRAGDIVIASGAVRQDGTSREYAPIEFPAVPDTDVIFGLVNAAKRNNYSYHTGVVQSKDSFYGQHSPEKMPVSYELLNKWEAWKRLHVLASEMESAALFTVTSYLGARAGAVFHVVWNQELAAPSSEGGTEDHDMDNAIKVTIDAIKELIDSETEGRIV